MIKETLVKISGAGASCVSILGSYQLCHSICILAISLLAIIGITVTGMPLLFLTKLALPFWILAIILFSVLLILKIRGMGCINNNSLTFNGGLLITGIPFLQDYYQYLWGIGSMFVLYSIINFFINKNRRSNQINLSGSPRINRRC